MFTTHPLTHSTREAEVKQLIADSILALHEYKNLVAVNPDAANAQTETQLEVTVAGLQQRYPFWFHQVTNDV